MKLAASILLSLLVCAVIAVQIIVVVKENAAKRDFPAIGQLVEVDGMRIHAYVAGSGPDLILIHGSAGNLRDFTFSMVDKLKGDFRVIAFDRPGLGHSDPLPIADNGIFAQANILSKAAAKLGVKDPIVLGQSYGGAVALAWALEMPNDVSALVSVSGPTHPWTADLPTFYKWTAPFLGRALVVPLISAFATERQIIETIESIFEPNTVPNGYNDYIGARLSITRDALRANAVQRAVLLDEVKNMAQRYDQLNLPVEIVHGANDTTVGVSIHGAVLAQENSNVHLKTLPGIAHMPHHNAKGDVIEAIYRAHNRESAASLD